MKACCSRTAITRRCGGTSPAVSSTSPRSRRRNKPPITNRRLFTLSILTACLLPPTLVTGFFGMNTKDLPFQNTDGGTWWALGVAVAAGVVVYWALRRMRAF